MDTALFATIGPVLAILAAFLLPVAVLVALLVLAKRRLEGRRGRFDDVLGGVARAGVMESHLNAGTPHPDDIATPTPRG